MTGHGRNLDDIISEADWTRLADAHEIRERELEVLRGVIDGLTETEIGLEMQVSRHTIRTYVKNLNLRFEVHNRAGLIVAVFYEILVHRIERRDLDRRA